MKSGIYKFTAPDGKVYIGQAKNIERRYREYSTDKIKEHRRFYESVLKYGFESHIHEVIEYCSFEELKDKERHYQDYYDVCGPNGLNCKLTKTGLKPSFVTKETCNLISKANTGRPLDEKRKKILLNANLGKKHSQETRKLQSLQRKGVPKFKHRGLKRTEETKQKISIARKIKIVCNETGIIYDSGSDLCKILGLSSTGNIYQHLKINKPKTVRGLTYRYL
ncbi:NUMOD3 domain-containing DNA-binding protein [Pedobacter agri]|uniref:NUMOD3 domain-containing DNA-binding protein n=1 Tax=Pedobacter agri TaxID=454586 RepID=UPI00277F2739|nr:NUMOD3 domain-containing DNA-binding protein [Pedobacter agri]MDQ1139456.1 group I intron endonuclease [Pedobacter agri]